MFDLSTLFKPIISTLDCYSEKYVEIPRCKILRPYIKCFRGAPQPYYSQPTISNPKIPEACMDIVFHINYSTNTITHTFNGIRDIPYYSNNKNDMGMISFFGVRFYFWAVHLFINKGLHNIVNSTLDVEQYFPDFIKNIENILIYYSNIEDRINLVESYFLIKLFNPYFGNNDVMNAVFWILKAKGVLSIQEIREYVHDSQRQLERLFNEFIGISLRKTADIVRYQNVWQDIFYTGTTKKYDIAYTYGFYDQSHLSNSYKKRYGRTPVEAYKSARKKLLEISNTRPT